MGMPGAAASDNWSSAAAGGATSRQSQSGNVVAVPEAAGLHQQPSLQVGAAAAAADLSLPHWHPHYSAAEAEVHYVVQHEQLQQWHAQLEEQQLHHLQEGSNHWQGTPHAAQSSANAPEQGQQQQQPQQQQQGHSKPVQKQSSGGRPLQMDWSEVDFKAQGCAPGNELGGA
jgi:hypothetical protein